MSLTIELSPVQETELQAAAQREGMPVSDHAHQLFAVALQQQIPLPFLPHEKIVAPSKEPLDWKTELKWAQEEAQKAFVTSGKTEAEVIADVEEAVDAYRAETFAYSQARTKSSGGNESEATLSL